MVWFAFASVAAVTVAAENIADKGTLRREKPALFSAVVMVLSGLIVLPFIGVIKWSELTLPIFAWIVLSSVVFSSAFTLLIRSMKRLEISVVSPMSTMTPVIGAILAATFLSESLSGGQVAGITMLVFGGYFLQLKHGQSWFYPIQRLQQCCDMQYLLVALTLYPTFSIMGRYTLSRLGVDPYSYIILIRLLAGLYFAGYLMLRGGGLQQVLIHAPRQRGALFWIALLNTMNATTLVLGLAAANAVRVLSVVRLSALISTIVGGEVFHEKNLLKKSLACIIMLSGALWVALG
jgi:drug/metabolite transporter (DMT)-like permease